MIVVGTDFSAESLRALSIAERLSDTLSLRVIIVHVKPHVDSPLPSNADQWLRDARVERRDVVVKAGTPWLELVRYAEEHDAQFICIAAHGMSGHQALNAGSNARRIVLRSAVPVVIAPAVIAPLKIVQKGSQ